MSSIYEQPADIRLLRLLSEFRKLPWTFHTCAGAMDLSSWQAYKQLKRLFREGSIDTDSMRWSFWKIRFGDVRFSITERGRQRLKATS